MLRICFLVSGADTNMLHVATACEQGTIPDAEVVGVVADRACLGIEAARNLGIIPTLVLSAGCASKEEWDSTLQAAISAYKPDLVCLGGFMRILGPKVLNAYAYHILNIHPGLLPSLAGKDPQRKALELGVSVTGNTVHIATDVVDDASYILAQDSVPVQEGDTEETLSTRLKERGYSTYTDAILVWRNHREEWLNLQRTWREAHGG